MKKPKKPKLPKKPKKTSPLHVWDRWRAATKAKLEAYQSKVKTWADEESKKKAMSKQIEDMDTEIKTMVTTGEIPKPTRRRKKS